MAQKDHRDLMVHKDQLVMQERMVTQDHKDLQE